MCLDGYILGVDGVLVAAQEKDSQGDDLALG